MIDLFFITSCFFFLWIVREIAFWLFVWQKSAYRADRFLAYFLQRKKKQTLFYSFLFFVKLSIFLLFIGVILMEKYLTEYQYGVLIYYVFLVLILSVEIFRKRLKRPRLTPRSFVIFFLTLFIILLFYFFPLLDTYFWLVLLDISVPYLLSLFVFLFSFPAEIYTDWRLERAIKKLRSYPNLTVIAVAGTDRGRVTEYLSHILRERFVVEKTQNSNILSEEISRVILSQLKMNTDILLTEISSDKPGEIASLCALIKPKIGVVMDKTNKQLLTDTELIESIPKDGLCLFSGKNQNLYRLYQKTRRQKVFLGSAPYATHRAENVITKRTKIYFDLKLRNKLVHFSLHSSHDLDALLPALYLADYLGMNVREIKKAIMAFS